MGRKERTSEGGDLPELVGLRFHNWAGGEAED